MWANLWETCAYPLGKVLVIFSSVTLKNIEKMFNDKSLNTAYLCTQTFL